ncbi:SRPBCC family protein [Streptomyces atratus]|uniref:Polyketide cyclase / dehydrase and lipid transport n=1 Tax=Streptomyces atratus TaxID=1893 RepID=A0A1K1XI95_STRAR|nr:SRPBCC family protein [Streptomyces atratus]SFX49107.1 Polyketide cyclase / dehydrase and lipid transport [Streptomyces atratus]
MDWSHYRFVSIWDLPAPPDAVYEILGRADDYPRWWPQVREVTSVDGTSGTTRIRSFLPYDLVMTVRERRRDPRAGVIEATLGGDLDGWVRWTVTPHGGGSRAVYEQEVDVRRRLMRLLAVPGRPVFRANHALMMRAGRRGLVARLEGV